MKRIVTWLLSTISVVVLLFGYHTSTAGSLAASPQTSVVSGGKAATTTSGTGGGSGSGGSGSSAGSNGSGGSGNGAGSGASNNQSSKPSTVTGPTVNTQWGPVQVQLTVDGSGTITDVTVLKYPNANGRDIQIANYALPILIQDTLDAQSANINMVSGATFTSYGYLQSLQGALDQAQL
ncbi:MAG: FMN-binding protein [Nocardioides sp.]